jgi:glutathione S-transferase
LDIYLHHYPASLFSEKIRLLLGYLGASWYSVEISSIMPRPLLMPLSGGYRRTPVLQIGANVYCDTAVIARGLARHFGDDDLFAPGFTANRVAEWADTQLFRVTVALNFRPEAVGAFMSQLPPEEIAAFQKDRADLVGNAPMVAFSPEVAQSYLATYLDQADRLLEGRFLFGDKPCIADFSFYHCLWFLDNNSVNAALLDPYENVRAWMRTMAGFGHGLVTESSGEAALEHAIASDPVAPQLEQPSSSQPGEVQVGQTVAVTPADYGRVPVSGSLVAWDSEEIVIAREDPATGPVMNHFPMAGFQVTPTGNQASSGR